MRGNILTRREEAGVEITSHGRRRYDGQLLLRQRRRRQASATFFQQHTCTKRQALSRTQNAHQNPITSDIPLSPYTLAKKSRQALIIIHSTKHHPDETDLAVAVFTHTNTKVPP
ncbi:hypothetical protein AVEN_112749-1 [Araneus ventricosus]|uniref:Uncharacterized protein n=1 Tax=Araneus ventricosus TaxID=182803 RepID=A0A4Y2F671_ARAVE|nr:hypothetical protein AVEN_112749-1 [Araneus ventricosus]